jgi:general secretion pathway protein J
LRTAGRGPARRGARGFTLLEVVVSVTILGLLILAGFGGLRLGGRSWEAGIARSEKSDAVHSVRAFVRSQLGQMVPIRWKAGEGTRLAFEGRANRLSCIAPAPAYVTTSGYTQVTLESEPVGRRSRLVMRLGVHDPSKQEFGAGPEDETVVLVEDAESVSLTYYGASGLGRVERWLRSWPDDAERLPRLVRVQVEPRAGALEPLDLVIPIYVEARG